MVGPEEKSVTAMIAQMRRKRAELLIELEKVQEWLSQVEAIFSRGKTIIGEDFLITPSATKTTSIEEKPETQAGRILRLIEKPDIEKTHAEKIKKLFEELGDLNIRQIDAQYHERNWPIKGKNRRQIIRNALLRKSDWFGQLKDKKTWDLKNRVEQKTQTR